MTGGDAIVLWVAVSGILVPRVLNTHVNITMTVQIVGNHIVHRHGGMTTFA